MKKFYFVLALLLSVSCSKDEVDDNIPSQSTASLVVTVYEDGKPVNQGVPVITFPATEELITDSFGQVEFENISADKFDIYAFVSGYGSGKTIAALNDNDLAHAEIQLIPGRFIEPSANIISPSWDEGFSEGEEITFMGQFSDNNTKTADLSHEWDSDIDGVLENSSHDENGTTILKINSLSKEEHYITLSVTNKLGITARDSLKINTLSPAEIVLTSSKNNATTVDLAWEQMSSDIVKIELVRYVGETSYTEEVIATFYDSAINSYTDRAVPFEEQVTYYIRYYAASGYSRSSNTVTEEGTPVFNIEPIQAAMDENDPLIYIRTSDNDILVLNYELNSVVKQVSFDAEIGHFTIGDTGFGRELYIPSSDGWIYIYDLNSLELKETINVGDAVESVAINDSGLIFSSSKPSPWWEEPLKVHSRATQEKIDGGGDIDGCVIKVLPGGNELIEISKGVLPIDMDYYKINAAGEIIVHEDDAYHGDHPLNPNMFKIAPKNDFLITSSDGAIYSADAAMQFKGLLPRDGAVFSDFEFSGNANTIYASLSNEKSVYAYNSSSLDKFKEWRTAGYPLFIFRKNDQLIMMSSPKPFSNGPYNYQYNYSNGFGLEILNLD